MVCISCILGPQLWPIVLGLATLLWSFFFGQPKSKAPTKLASDAAVAKAPAAAPEGAVCADGVCYLPSQEARPASSAGAGE